MSTLIEGCVDDLLDLVLRIVAHLDDHIGRVFGNPCLGVRVFGIEAHADAHFAEVLRGRGRRLSHGCFDRLADSAAEKDRLHYVRRQAAIVHRRQLLRCLHSLHFVQPVVDNAFGRQCPGFQCLVNFRCIHARERLCPVLVRLARAKRTNLYLCVRRYDLVLQHARHRHTALEFLLQSCRAFIFKLVYPCIDHDLRVQLTAFERRLYLAAGRIPVFLCSPLLWRWCTAYCLAEQRWCRFLRRSADLDVLV